MRTIIAGKIRRTPWKEAKRKWQIPSPRPSPACASHAREREMAQTLARAKRGRGRPAKRAGEGLDLAHLDRHAAARLAMTSLLLGHVNLNPDRTDPP
jgi:hypothetical protein